ncbi:MAG: rhodanese-like domain-containing protein [Planctomycetaceae bacterium]|nr:rhodanese-like domain-containing protein [Planctomycetaceae bacterium]
MSLITRHGMMLLALLACAVTVQAAQPSKDSLPVVKQNLESGKAVLLDVREMDEWQMGHLAAASLLPLSRIERGVSADQLNQFVPGDKIIYLHCAYGSRSVSAAGLLQKTGRDVRALSQGYDDLLKFGFRPATK